MQASDVQAARALESGLQRAGFDSNRPKAQLVKVVLPGPPAKNASGKKPVRAKSARRLASPAFAQTQQTFVVLTEWGDEGVPPRVVFAVAQNSGVRYAAVAVANGWLIVQI